MKNIKAVIFDADGLIIDTERTMPFILRDVMAEFGYSPPDFVQWYYKNASGCRDDLVVQKLVKEFGIEVNQATIKRFNEYRDAYYQVNPPQVKPGFFELLDFLKNKRIKLAICSSSRSEQLYNKLELAGVLVSDFDVIIDGSMVENPKPHPQPYLLACKKLGIKPKNAIALEDSNHGIESAYRAGLNVISVPDVQVNDAEKIKLACYTLNSLDKVIALL